ncbi:MAG TPA: SDR family NAD(P)-dependent oxidoreductase [Reyranella sp.]|nr:SDR family NAD(P)-dependent oxidoreductase [Reyranella sp.]
MATAASSHDHPARKAYIITGPTSGIGRATVFEIVKQGAVILVGRDREKLTRLQQALQRDGGLAVSVLCDLSDMASVRRAAAEIVGLGHPIAGLLNNAGMLETQPTKNAAGWDMTFATNHLGPFALTEALAPHLPDGARVLFVASTVEDPDANPGKAVGYRGGRYISAEASARGAWQPGGSKVPGADAYATSKQCNLAAAMVFARETPRLRFNAVTPGLIPTTGLFGGDANSIGGILSKYVTAALLPLCMPFMTFLSTPKHAARVITKILTDTSGQTGIYYDERGRPMLGSARVREPNFQDRVVAETRALLGVAARNDSRPDAQSSPNSDAR